MIPRPTFQFKLVLVGQSSVGKSSILTRFVDDQFDESLLSTIGVDFKFRKLKIDNEEVKLQIWDTAGQETFRSIISAYYHSSDAIIIVYDITSYASIEGVKEYWLQEAQNNNKNNASVILVGNKLDIVKDNADRRQVEGFTIESITEHQHIDRHFEVSARTGEGVDKAFTQICRLLIAKKKSAPSRTMASTPGEGVRKLNPPGEQQKSTDPQTPYQPKKCC